MYPIYNIYFVISSHIRICCSQLVSYLILVVRRRFSYYLYTSSHAIARAFETILYDFYRLPMYLSVINVKLFLRV